MRAEREQGFWDERVPSLEECCDLVAAGPDVNTVRAIELLQPLDHATVLDLGCGAGIFAAWLGREGARVTGIDVSAGQIERAAELHEVLGLQSRFVAAAVSRDALGSESFDRLAGRYVLHHLDPPSVTPELASLLRLGGKAAFVETMGLNPILRFARTRLVGRCGIPRYGTEDERPLTGDDLRALEEGFGTLRLATGEMQFLRILDRQILHYRSRTASRALDTLDDLLLRAGFSRWSYHQVVYLERTTAMRPTY